MKNLYRILLIIFVFLSSGAYAQWSSNPAINLAVCDTTGEQALAKIESSDYIVTA